MPEIISKFDAAERQLMTSIRLFFRKEDAVSVHTLSEAASQVLYDIAGHNKTKSLIRENPSICENQRAVWLKYAFKARNFFKHANRDMGEVLEFRHELNEFSLLESTRLHVAIKGMWVPETFFFSVWFSLKYRDLLVAESDYAKEIYKMSLNPNVPRTDDMDLFDKSICALRNSEFSIPNITLTAGLIADVSPEKS